MQAENEYCYSVVILTKSNWIWMMILNCQKGRLFILHLNGRKFYEEGKRLCLPLIHYRGSLEVNFQILIGTISQVKPEIYIVR